MVRLVAKEYSSDALDQYLKEITRFPLLKDNEYAVAVRARQGDQEARDLLIKSNLRFVVATAKKYQNKGLPLIDLINEGNEGLVKAADKFDPDQGVKFISYAVWWIRQSIFEALGNTGAARIPLNKTGDLNQVNTLSAIIMDKLQCSHDTAIRYAVQQLFPKKDEQQQREMERLYKARAPVSLDAPVGERSQTSMLEHLVAEEEDAQENAERIDLDDRLEAALATLKEREARILRLYFGLDGEEHTLEEIGSMMGITRERVRQIREKALSKLRHGKHRLDHYMP